jgi:hypothetical protein
MSSEANSEKRLRRDDCVVLTLDLEDCPMAEIPLLELLDPDTATLVPEYQKIIRETVHQQLEECTWLANDDETRTRLTDAGFGMCHVRERGAVITLRKAALQRLIDQRLDDRTTPTSMVHAQVLICFLVAPNMLPSPPPASTHAGSRRSGSRSGRSSRHFHHPLIHSVYSTANEIPKQRRSETFSLYTRRLQDFMARERLATRTYTESEALDLAVRNLIPEWRAEFRRLVERDKRSGPEGTMPFKLCMPQLATTFVEYAAELGRDPPTTTTSDSGGTSYRPANHHSVRRIETSPSSSILSLGSDVSLADEEIDLLVRAIAHNQGTSPLCLGCHQPGHTLEQCNRFFDYIVAESLAQRHPQLKAQVALSHKQFRTRLANARSGRGRSNPGNHVVRSLQVDASEIPPDLSLSTIEEPEEHVSYQQHSIHTTDDDVDADFEACFSSVSMNAVSVAITDDPALPFFDSVVVSPPSPLPSLLLRRLAATRDTTSELSYAHADNGSMACTTDELKLLFS